MDECVATGIVVDNGVIYHSPDYSRPYITRSTGDLDAHYRSFEEQVMEMFNDMAERQKRIEEKLDALLSEIGPKTINKPKSLKPSSRP